MNISGPTPEVNEDEKFTSQPSHRHDPCTKPDRESGWTKNPTHMDGGYERAERQSRCRAGRV